MEWKGERARREGKRERGEEIQFQKESERDLM